MTGRRRWQALAAGGVITAAVIFGSAAPAMAASPARATATPSACNTQIIDGTPGTVLRSDGDVAQAMAQLEAKGADVRIRVFQTAPGGSLDAYEASQVRDCPSWSLGGGIKPNLLVFLVSLDHQDAVFYGSNYGRLQGQVDQIRADMGGDFRSGGFAAGIAKGEQETYSALYPSGTPAWLVIAIAVGIILVLGIAVCAIAGGGGSYGPGRGGVTYISTGSGWGGGGGGGGFSSGGGTSGGSSGSW
jgi:hypothetical protein